MHSTPPTPRGLPAAWTDEQNSQVTTTLASFTISAQPWRRDDGSAVDDAHRISSGEPVHLGLRWNKPYPFLRLLAGRSNGQLGCNETPSDFRAAQHRIVK